MRDILRRAVALILCVTMLVGSIPVSFAKDYFSSPVFLGGEDPTAPAGSPAGNENTAAETFESSKGGYVSVAVNAESTIRDDPHTEFVGQTFRYYGTVTFQLRGSWKYHDAGVTSLFTSYDDVILRVKAPDGIVFVDAVGNEIAPDADGYVTVLGKEDVPAPTSGTVDRTFSINAKMTGNGSVTNNKDYAALDIQFDTRVIVCGTNELDPTTEHHITYEDITNKTNDSAMRSRADGEWTVRKAALPAQDQQVRRDGENIILTYYIDTGRKVNDLPSGMSSDYLRYGLIDIADDTFVLYDAIEKVQDKNGNEVLPTGISVTRLNDNGQYETLPAGTLVSDEDNSGFTLLEGSLHTLDASAYSAGTVKAYTKFKVELTYPAERFTWPIVESDPEDFGFTDKASIAYQTKDDPEHIKGASDDETIYWHDIAGGGNISVTELFFLTEDATSGTAFNGVYQNLFCTGETGIQYHLYAVDEIDGELVIHNEPGDWTETLTLQPAGNGTVSTAGIEELNNKIPVGKIAIFPDYSGRIDTEWVVPVSETNGDAPAYIIAEVEENKTTSEYFGLRYINGGFVNAAKELSDGGNALKDGASISDTTFVFTPDEGGTPVTMQIGTDGKGTVSLRPGHYAVTEIAPEGYVAVAFPDGITVEKGGTVQLGGGNIVNYPEEGTLAIRGKTVSAWVMGDYNKTENTHKVFSDEEVKYSIEKNVNGTWETVRSDLSLERGDIEIKLPRYDSEGNLIEYRVKALSDGSYTRCGSVLNESGNLMSEAEYSISFTFPDGEWPVNKVHWYYWRKGSILVTKTVIDARTSPATAEGWPVLLTWEDPVGTPHSMLLYTDKDGKAEFTDLIKTDANGDPIVYTVTEAIPAAQADIWSTVYDPAATEGTGSTVDVGSRDVDLAEVGITNTLLAGELTLTKVDADEPDARLKDAQYKVYYLDGETRYYVTDILDAFGIRTFSTDETAAAVFTTAETTGAFSITDIPCGRNYYAIEILAPQGYFLNAEPAAFDPLTPDKLSSNLTVTNTKYPTLTVKKYGYNPGGTSYTTISAGTQVDFELYTKDAATGAMVRAKDENGEDISISAVWTKSTYAAQTDPVSLPDYGTYYLLETDHSNKLLTPTQQKVSGETNYYTDPATGIVYWKIDVKTNNGKQRKATLTAKDVLNTATLNVSKFNIQDPSTALSDTTGFTYSVMARIRTGDTETKSLLPGSWSTSVPSGVSESELAEYAPEAGYQWYYSTAKSAGSLSGLPVKDGEGNDIVYRILELTPPENYYNKVNPDGTQGHSVSDPATLSVGKNFIYDASLSDLPEVNIAAGKSYVNIWDLITGNPVSYLQAGATLALYHVTAEGTLDRLMDSGLSTGNAAGYVFNAGALDYREQYVVVETNSNGYDTWYEGGKSGGKIAVEPESLVGKTLTELTAGKYKVQSVDLSGIEPGGTASCSLKNYVPYFQIRLTKQGYMNDAGGRWKYEEALNTAKFHMYVISASAYAALGSDPALAISSGAATTDGYTYETGMNGDGKFITVDLPYDDDNVYIFEEYETPRNYTAANKYTVITPSQYKAEDENGQQLYQNSIYEPDDPVENDTDSNEDNDGSERFFRVALNKYLNTAGDNVFDPAADTPLASVTFSLRLADKEGKIVFSDQKDDPLYTFFTTGTNSSEEDGDKSFACSESFKLDRSFFVTLAEKVGADNIDSIFTFHYNDGTARTYAEFLTAVAHGEEGSGSLLLENFEYSFKLVLTEESFPDSVTPFLLERFINIKTSKDGMYTDKTYTVDKNNPVLNVSGKYVFAQAQKLVNGALWTPADEDDYVLFEFELISSTAPVDEQLSYASVRIDSSNYTILPVVRLTQTSTYRMTETHAPKGYDKPATNYVEFNTGDLTTRVASDPEVRIQKVKMTDTPYITFTVTKKDPAGDPVSGKKLKLIYSSGDNADTIIDANQTGLSEGVSGVTDDNGQVTFTVPRYDYRTVSGTAGIAKSYETVATYRVIELDSAGARMTDFDLINGSVTTQKASEAQDIIVVNPEKTDITVLKNGITDVVSPLAGVQFKLQYAPFTTHEEYASMPASIPSTASFTDAGTFTTGEDGTLSLTRLSSGYYYLTEDSIPDGYMYEKGTARFGLILMTPGDAASMKILDTDYTPGQPLTVVSDAEVISEGDKTSDNKTKQYITAAATYADGVIKLTITNTHKGALNITKLFTRPDSAFGVAVPTKVRYYIRNSDNDKTLQTVEMTITGNSGSVFNEKNDYIWLEPGTYTVVEETAPADNWYAAAEIRGSADPSRDTAETMIEPAAAEDGKTRHSVRNVVITAQNAVYELGDGTAVEKPVTVSFTNASAKTRLIANKIDDQEEPQPVVGAGFVLYCVAENGQEKFYKGTDTNGLGVWSSYQDAMVFETDTDGKLTVDVVAAFDHISADIDPSKEGVQYAY